MDGVVLLLVGTVMLVGAYLVGRGLFDLGWYARHRAKPGSAHYAQEDSTEEGGRSREKV
jgi:hypothetical protein